MSRSATSSGNLVYALVENASFMQKTPVHTGWTAPPGVRAAELRRTIRDRAKPHHRRPRPPIRAADGARSGLRAILQRRPHGADASGQRAAPDRARPAAVPRSAPPVPVWLHRARDV